jgi:hypothetical protein
MGHLHQAVSLQRHQRVKMRALESSSKAGQVEGPRSFKHFVPVANRSDFCCGTAIEEHQRKQVRQRHFSVIKLRQRAVSLLVSVQSLICHIHVLPDRSRLQTSVARRS